MLMLLKCESLNGSGLESTKVQERRHGPRVSHTGSGFLAMLTSLSVEQLENLSSLASDCTLKVATIRESVSEFEVLKRWWVELQSCMVTKVTCSTEVEMLRRKSMHGSRRR